MVKPGGVLVCQAIGIQGQVDLKYSSNVSDINERNPVVVKVPSLLLTENTR